MTSNATSAAKAKADDGKSDEQTSSKAKVGDIVKIGEDRYALVVGIETDVEHVHEGRQENTVEDHPIVVDFPSARRLETEHSVVK